MLFDDQPTCSPKCSRLATSHRQEEDIILGADARAEELRLKAEAKLKRQRELELKEAERDAAEMAELKDSDPEVWMIIILVMFQQCAV